MTAWGWWGGAGVSTVDLRAAWNRGLDNRTVARADELLKRRLKTPRTRSAMVWERAVMVAAAEFLVADLRCGPVISTRSKLDA